MTGTRWSLALRDFPPDYADTTIIRLPAGAPTDPRAWADATFSLRTMPGWVRAALGLRQLLVPLLGVPRAPRSTFAVDEVAGDASCGEALIVADDRHLDFRCGVAVDAHAGLVAVTTNVRLHNRRGRLYFLPVRALHPVVVRSMLNRAAHVLAR
ncbi:MAG: DUF2867 domain-containing protein [Cellulomonas sp.]|uniref:DUF2867 domain-containing protein n=1 Tax=Cellulomonas gelida TaxID=1712 RepID=A0A4Y3KMG8_9CELL|nr:MULTISPECIES: DUF2867 domain-containing protein [Cellulomonas]KMM46285.1 hypothetical protein CWIS_06010 [Cellulomonas sp. A375-1]MCR6648615.1 DUF2867 domain-containing protein [Cellulomonas sp.]MCR6704566.1 DUF2867 domain-containing protein [Cellulomonas sp.]GEA84335.1 hypothetical protein CGE01nite_15860 [Cellulomonas gelida]GGL32877.1 hypothetical protein GCM10009774_24260 [Cellulomonas gelida]